MEELQPARRAFGAQLLRIALLAGALLIGTGFIARYPGSLPVGWRQVDGMVASVVGKQTGSKKLYYPTVQYQALGYSYEINDPNGTAYAPDLGTLERVAFDPQEPSHARLLSATPPNYFKAAFPALGILVIAGGVFVFTAPERHARIIAKAQAAEEKRAAKELADKEKKTKKPKLTLKPIKAFVKTAKVKTHMPKKPVLDLKAQAAKKASALKTKTAELKSERLIKKQRQSEPEAPTEKPVKQKVPKARKTKVRKAKPRKPVNVKKQAIMLSNLKLDQ